MENTEKKNVFELAITLGKALKEDERLVRMENARKAYEEDPSLKQLMTEYDVQQKAIQQVATAEEFDAAHNQFTGIYRHVLDITRREWEEKKAREAAGK